MDTKEVVFDKVLDGVIESISGGIHEPEVLSPPLEVTKKENSYIQFILTVVLILIVGRMCHSVASPFILEKYEVFRAYTLESSGQKLWVGLNTTLQLDEYSPEDLEQFIFKYSIWQPTFALSKGNLTIEKNLMELMKKSPEKEAYIKIIFQHNKLISISLARDNQGTNAVTLKGSQWF